MLQVARVYACCQLRDGVRLVAARHEFVLNPEVAESCWCYC